MAGHATPAAIVEALLGHDRADPALAWEGVTFDYGWLGDAVERLAGRLERLAGRELAGARIAVLATNSPALVVGLLAAWRLRACVVPVSARLREYEVAHVLSDCEPVAAVSLGSAQGYRFDELLAQVAPDVPGLRGCLIVDELGEVQHELPAQPRAGEPGSEAVEEGIGTILYTSGTTGEPKGTLCTHASALHTAHALAGLLRLTPADGSLLVVPASHAFGLGCLLAALVSGSPAVLVGAALSADPLLAAAERHGAAVLHGSPALFAGLLASRPDAVERFSRGFVAGALCAPGVIEGLEARGCTILNVFGMTELGAASACRLDDPPRARRTTVGTPLPGYEFRVAPAGEPGAGRFGVGEGELQVRGPHVTPGYHRRADLTAAAFDGDWFRTGDIGSIDADGRVTISGRAKEVVQVGGFNVFPAEVENFLQTHPDVAVAGVIGMPHERLGEALRAYVVVRPGSSLTTSGLLAYARPRIAGYKLPYAIELVEELPLLTSGKVDRRALERRAEGVGTGA